MVPIAPVRAPKLAPAEVPISPATIDSLEKNPSCLDHIKQTLKASASARGPAFWVTMCCCCLFLLAGIIALIIYFGFWVGIPTVSILGVIPPDPARAAQAVKIDVGQPGVRPPSVRMNVIIKVRIENPNKLPLSFEPVQIQAFSKKMPGVQIGSATIDLLELPKEDSLDVQIPIDIFYSFKNDPNQAIPKELTDSCTVPPGRTSPIKPLDLIIAVSPRLKITNEIRIDIPKISTEQSMDCPLTQPQTMELGGVKVQLNNINWLELANGRVSSLF